jgi:pSer/pThr/pTyr-binding forkhead associated (FHA) protein
VPETQRKFCVRVLSGPSAGTVVPFFGRMEIGRSSSADLQLNDTEVSRSHAVVLERPEGPALVDTMSTNGTWMDGERIGEVHLAAGDLFRIGKNELAFDALDRHLEVAARPRDKSLHSRRVTERVPFKRQRSPTGSHEMVGTGGYEGDLLADIVVYRALRLRAIKDGAVPKNLEPRFDELETLLRIDSGGTFRRFDLDVPGTLRWEDERTLDHVQVIEVAADGALVTAPEREGVVDCLCWLSIMEEAQAGRPTVFPGRVVWVRGGELGLIFSGATLVSEPGVPERQMSGSVTMLDLGRRDR